MLDSIIDRSLKLGQLVALVVVPIWVVSQIISANAILSARVELIAKTQASVVEKLERLSVTVNEHTARLAIQEGIRIGLEEAEKRARAH